MRAFPVRGARGSASLLPIPAPAEPEPEPVTVAESVGCYTEERGRYGDGCTVHDDGVHRCRERAGHDVYLEDQAEHNCPCGTVWRAA